LQTCQVKSATSQVHDWVVYRLVGILGTVGHKVKIHKITPARILHRLSTGKERGVLEIKDYVVLQKPQDHTDPLPPAEPSACETCRSLSFSFSSFIVPTLIYKSSMQLSLYHL
jgi:hypothetical protein